MQADKGYFKQRCFHRMARQNKSSSLHMARASPEGSKVSYEDRKSTLDSWVWKAIRRGSAEEEVRKHWDRVIGA